MNVETLLSRLRKVRGKHPKWIACCPAHEDRSPSLSIKHLDDGRILVHCHAGCGTSDVMSAIGLTLADLCKAGPHGHYIAGEHFKHRQPENVPLAPSYMGLMSQIQRLRASR